MSNISLSQLLEAGVHFGHLKKKWNPKTYQDFSFNKFEDALGWYQAAQVAYRELGDRTSSEELQEKLNQTKERI